MPHSRRGHVLPGDHNPDGEKKRIELPGVLEAKTAGPMQSGVPLTETACEGCLGR